MQVTTYEAVELDVSAANGLCIAANTTPDAPNTFVNKLYRKWGESKDDVCVHNTDGSASQTDETSNVSQHDTQETEKGRDGATACALDAIAARDGPWKYISLH